MKKVQACSTREEQRVTAYEPQKHLKGDVVWK